MPQNDFKNPPADYRILPFWFWNGSMDEEEVAWQIEEMAAKGVGGFFLCARQGLTIPYLSQTWFDKVSFAVEKAKEQGLEVWLYDEYPYPSGIAGGEVILEHPDAKHRILREHCETVTGPQEVTVELPWARLLVALAVPLEGGEHQWAQALDLKDYVGNRQTETVFQKTGLTSYNKKRFFTYGPRKVLSWQAPEGSWRIMALLEEELKDFKYYGTFVDPGHKEAMATFIRLTHGRYAEALGREFGGAIKGMFTDEIAFLGPLPWSARLEPFFRERSGYSLTEKLPQLLYSRDGNTPKLRYDYFQAVHLLLRESYHQQVRDWCDAHGLNYIAEVPATRMTTQCYSHIPGGDSAHEKVGRSLEWIIDRYALNLRSNPKMVSSLARQLGSKRALIECFHSIGWSMTLLDAKWMIDRMAAMGINMFNLHAFFYTLNGLAKYDAPPSQFYQNPYWAHFRQLADYAARVSLVMSQGRAAIRVAVLDPVTTLWTHLGNPYHEFRYVGHGEEEARRLERLKEDWAGLCKALLMHHVDYDHLDPELLGDAEVQDGELRLGQASYSVLILPPMTNLEASAWEKLQAFLRDEGTVIALGLLPYEVIDGNDSIEGQVLETFSLSTSPREAYWQAAPAEAPSPVKGQDNAYFIPGSGAGAHVALIALLERVAPKQVRLGLADGEENTFLLQHRIMEDNSHLLFVAHQEDGERQVQVEVELPYRQMQAERLDLESGETTRLFAERTATGCRLALTFAPYGSQLLRFRAGGAGAGPEPQRPWKLELEREGWTVEALQANVLRLDSFDLALGEAAGEGAAWQRVGVKTLIDQCAGVSDHLPLPLKFPQTFGTPMRLELAYPLLCRYRRTFEVEHVPPQCHLLMDEGAISGGFTIYLNGHAITRDHFEPHFHYDHCNRRCDVTPYLTQGQNTLLVHLEAQHDWDGLLEPLYLTGSFGIHFDEAQQPVMKRTPQRAVFKRGFLEGYPYYAGTLSLIRTLTLEHPSEQQDFELALPAWTPHFHDCAEVLVNQESLGVRPWPPYHWTGKTADLHAGENEVEIRITNTLIGMLEGKFFDFPSHTLPAVEEGQS